MNNLDFNIPDATNEPIKEYTQGTPEKISLKAKLKEMKSYKLMKNMAQFTLTLTLPAREKCCCHIDFMC